MMVRSGVLASGFLMGVLAVGFWGCAVGDPEDPADTSASIKDPQAATDPNATAGPSGGDQCRPILDIDCGVVKPLTAAQKEACIRDRTAQYERCLTEARCWAAFAVKEKACGPKPAGGAARIVFDKCISAALAEYYACAGDGGTPGT